MLVLAGLLAVVAVAAAGHRAGGGHAGPPSRAFFDYLLSALLVLMAVTGVGLAWLLMSERREAMARRPVRRRGTVTALAILLGVALALVAARQLGLRPDTLFHRARHHAQTAEPRTPPPKPSAHARAARPGAASHFRWLPAALVGGAFAAVLLMGAYQAARRRVDEEERLSAAQEVAAALDESVDDLRAEPDARRAIVAAYARMERALATVGVARRPAEAPLEYLTRALEGLRASGPAVRRLTELFRVARFSEHRLGQPEKEAAIDALLTVRDELRAEPS